MDVVEIIKICASIFNIIGASILAYRVTGILKALSLVAIFHETNINGIAGKMTGTKNNIVIAKNSVVHVEKAKKLPLLILGFTLTIFAGVLQFIALSINIGWFNL